MKAELDKEIDALLRRNARAAAGRVARGDGGQAAAHLDADELSAFAENALPAAARVGAVAHLADCDECRKQVVTLSLAADAAGELERRAAAAVPASVETGGAASARGWLASLFSPRVLRYVAPALALCIVAAVALLVLRTRRESGSQVAMQKEAGRDAARPNAPASSGVADIGTANANVAAEPTAEVAADPEEQRPAGQTAEHDGPRPVAPVNEAPDGSTEEQPRDAPSQTAPMSEAAGVAAAPPPPPRPVATEAASGGAPAAAQPPAEVAREESKTKKEDRRQGEDEAAQADTTQAEKRADQNYVGDNQQAPDDSRRNKPARPATGSTRAPASRPDPSEPLRRNRSLGGPAAGRSAEAGGRGASEREDSGAETREAAGHRFRRQGRAWVDVNYRGSMPMTGVRRGTEAFRALVADIPELGRVASQIGGEVITVVRGRAYRIQ